MIILPSYIRDYFISRYTNPPSISWKVNQVFLRGKTLMLKPTLFFVSPKCIYCCLILPKPNGTCGPFDISRLTRSSTCLGFLSPICTSAGGCSKYPQIYGGGSNGGFLGFSFEWNILKHQPVLKHIGTNDFPKKCGVKSPEVWERSSDSRGFVSIAFIDAGLYCWWKKSCRTWDV